MSPFLRKSQFPTLTGLRSWFSGPWDMLEIFLLNAIFIFAWKEVCRPKYFLNFVHGFKSAILAIFQFWQVLMKTSLKSSNTTGSYNSRIITLISMLSKKMIANPSDNTTKISEFWIVNNVITKNFHDPLVMLLNSFYDAPMAWKINGKFIMFNSTGEQYKLRT